MTNPQTPAQLRAEAEALDKLLVRLPGKAYNEIMVNWPCEGQFSLVWNDKTAEEIERDNLHQMEGMDYRILAEFDAEDSEASKAFWPLAQQVIPLATAHADLLRRHAALLEQDRWIPVEERLPEEGEGVMVWASDHTQRLDWISEGTWAHLYPLGAPTHWRPLPAPPAPASAEGGAE